MRTTRSSGSGGSTSSPIDHKVIGIQYGLTALVFLLFGFSLMLLMRWQLAFPGEPMPLIGALLSDARTPGGVMLPEFYNQLGAMHGTIMVFLGVVPLAVGAFGNYVVPLQIGAPDMAFPKLNMASYWCFLLGGMLMFASFFVPGGAAQSGWTSYPPLSDHRRLRARRMWLFGMVLLITSSLLGSVNFIVTIVQLRAPRPHLHAAAVLRLGAARHRRSCCCSRSRRSRRRRPAAHGPRSPAPASSCPPAWWSAGQALADLRAAAARCSGSTCSGSSRTPRSTC